MRRFSLLRVDILVAILALLLSGYAILYFATTVTADNRQVIKLPMLLNQEAKQFLILHKKNCLGYLQTSLSSNEDAYLIKTEAKIFFKQYQEKLEIKITSLIDFNLLGVNSGSISTISSEDLWLRVTSIDSDPIKIDIRGKVLGNDTRQSFSVPGPVILKKTLDGSYQLEFEKVNNMPLINLQQVSSHNSQLLGVLGEIKIIASKDAEDECKEVQ
jgi:hypothetical protein